MLFKDLLDKKFQQLQAVFDQLYKLCLDNQTHSGDMLLACQNGHITDKDNRGNSESGKFYWQVGTTMDGHSETTHYNFIRGYVQSLVEMPLEDYIKLIEYDPNRSEEINELNEHEAFTIQIEMLIYLKIWESDSFLTRLYQFINLSNGISYDWHFKIENAHRKNSIGKTRSGIVESILENPKGLNTKICDVLSKCYNSQLRNAIAHSQYAIIGTNITLTNNLKDDDRHGISFAEWRDLFHETIAFHRLYLSFIENVNDYYFEKAEMVKKKCEIRISRRIPKAEILYRILYTRDHFKDWTPHNT